MAWDYDYYCYAYSPKHKCNVGLRTKDRRWRGKYCELPNELRRMLGLPQNHTVVRAYGECKSRVDIWYEI